MTTIAPTTQIFNDDIDATGVAQQRPRGERFHAGMTAVATAPTAETADSTGVMLRLASLSMEAFAGLVLEWLPVHDTVTGASIRRIPPPPPRMRRRVELHFASSTASVESMSLPAHTLSSALADALLAPVNDAPIQDHSAAPPTPPSDVTYDHSTGEDVLSELLQEDQVPNERSTDAAHLDQSPLMSDVNVITTVERDDDDQEEDVQDLWPLDVLVSTPCRPRFTDGPTTNVGGKFVPFHPADVRVWWDRRQAYVLPTVAESTTGQRAEELKVAAAPPSAAPPAVKSKAQTQSKARTANAALAHVVLDEVLDASPNVQWKDIAGLDDAKQMLQVGIPFTTILYDYSALGSDRIATPPTRSVHWFVRRSQRCATLWASWNSVTASTLTSKWVGEGEKLVRALFDMARELQPSVIFIDEIDSLLSTRSAGEHDASRRLKNEVRSMRLNTNPVYNWYSGSDIMNLCKEAAMGPLRSLGDRLKQARAQDIRPISKADFTDALARVSPSVSADTLRRLTEWNARYGLQKAT
ncbi:hypothetical protein DYB37_005934 [Aphanomyces astaci]|uniref:AAA+ ATPase domain-containing protein n=1 Tax=Aphanomyces astaci TaxID=112090 RepID=A0A418E4C6_APHAT|nr:hypothetical protein DYB37_005934 [Aphanomyces astaci]